MALVLDVCRWLHLPDPAEFFALPEGVQQMWLEHAANEFSGAYLPEPKQE